MHTAALQRERDACRAAESKLKEIQRDAERAKCEVWNNGACPELNPESNSKPNPNLNPVPNPRRDAGER